MVARFGVVRAQHHHQCVRRMALHNGHNVLDTRAVGFDVIRKHRGAAREALPNLGKQHYDHLDMLRRLIIRRKADREDLRRIRDDRVDEYEAMKVDYERTCKMLDREYEEV